MICPKCKNSPLKSSEIATKQLVLDQCSQCMGVWFDKGELTTLLGSREKKDFNIPKFATEVPGAECPRCKVSLYEFCYPGTLTLVDGCKKCAGVWLDNKEWKVINNARDESNNINCPKCHTRQKPAESCAKCGIIIAKHYSTGSDSNLNIDSKTTSSPNYDVVNEESYADDIPGLKGSLLQTIDRMVKSLSADIF